MITARNHITHRILLAIYFCAASILCCSGCASLIGLSDKSELISEETRLIKRPSSYQFSDGFTYPEYLIMLTQNSTCENETTKYYKNYKKIFWFFKYSQRVDRTLSSAGEFDCPEPPEEKDITLKSSDSNIVLREKTIDGNKKVYGVDLSQIPDDSLGGESFIFNIYIGEVCVKQNHEISYFLAEKAWRACESSKKSEECNAYLEKYESYSDDNSKKAEAYAANDAYETNAKRLEEQKIIDFSDIDAIKIADSYRRGCQNEEIRSLLEYCDEANIVMGRIEETVLKETSRVKYSVVARDNGYFRTENESYEIRSETYWIGDNPPQYLVKTPEHQVFQNRPCITITATNRSKFTITVRTTFGYFWAEDFWPTTYTGSVTLTLDPGKSGQAYECAPLQNKIASGSVSTDVYVESLAYIVPHLVKNDLNYTWK